MSFLKKIWNGWKIFAKTLGRINTKIILSLFFFFIFGPIALIRKLFYLFKKKSSANTFWIKKESKRQKLKDYYRQF